MRLVTYLRESGARPFAWGPADCGKLAADWIQAVRGFDPAPWSRGTYADASGAYAAMRAAGFRSLEAVVTAALGQPLDVPLKAQRGDVVSLKDRGRIVLGVVDPSGRAIAVRSPSGLMRVPLRRARKAWRCGRGD